MFGEEIGFANQILSDFGPVVFFLVVLIYFLIKLNEQHRNERTEWREDITRTSSEYLQSQRDTTEVIRELTRVIERIK